MWCRVGSWFKNNIVAKGPIVTIEIPGGPKSHNRDTWETKIAQLEPIEQKLHNRDNQGTKIVQLKTGVVKLHNHGNEDQKYNYVYIKTSLINESANIIF